jgi:hypothetical protein
MDAKTRYKKTSWNSNRSYFPWRLSSTISRRNSAAPMRCVIAIDSQLATLDKGPVLVTRDLQHYCFWIIEASVREGTGTYRCFPSHRTAVAVGGQRTHLISSVLSPLTCDSYLLFSKFLGHPTARPTEGEHLLPRNTLAVNTVLITNPQPLLHAPTANWASLLTRGTGRV